jgi:hypothetical protein
MNPDLLYPDPLLFRLSHWHGDVAVMVLEHYQSFSTSMGWITVPTGFHTDGLSIPQAAWPIVGPSNSKAFKAGILHDFLYSKASDKFYSEFTRKDADILFLEVMHNLGIPWHRRNVIYAAVRAFGWRSYKKR